MPSPKKAQASVTLDTKEVSHKPHLEQCSLAGNRSGHLDPSMGILDEDTSFKDADNLVADDVLWVLGVGNC